MFSKLFQILLLCWQRIIILIRIDWEWGQNTPKIEGGGRLSRASPINLLLFLWDGGSRGKSWEKRDKDMMMCKYMARWIEYEAHVSRPRIVIPTDDGNWIQVGQHKHGQLPFDESRPLADETRLMTWLPGHLSGRLSRSLGARHLMSMREIPTYCWEKRLTHEG